MEGNGKRKAEIRRIHGEFFLNVYDFYNTNLSISGTGEKANCLNTDFDFYQLQG